MKRGTPEHPKMKRLARALRVNQAQAVGILESLWHWAGRFAPQGDIGRFSDSDIADSAYWTKEPGILIEALVESKWVQRDPAHRLIIHDWHDHAEESVKKYLARHNLTFVSLGGVVETISGHVQQMSENVCLPEPIPKPLPEPKPKAPGGTSDFETWWKIYPKKSGKEAARKAYESAVKRIRASGQEPKQAHQTLLDAVSRYAVSPKAKGEYCWNPATWLNQGHWEDDPAVWQRGDDKQGRVGSGQTYDPALADLPVKGSFG